MHMLGYIRSYFLNRSIKAYIFRLGPALKKRYGASDQYTVLQIQKTAKALGLNITNIDYAIALFRENESENTRILRQLDQHQLDELRGQISGALFGGAKYDATDVLRLSSSSGWKGGPPPDWMANRMGKTSL